MGCVLAGKGVGKSFFSEMIIEAISDGDLSTKNSVVEYSTDCREVVTVESMIIHHDLRSRKGRFIDETV